MLFGILLNFCYGSFPQDFFFFFSIATAIGSGDLDLEVYIAGNVISEKIKEKIFYIV